MRTTRHNAQAEIGFPTDRDPSSVGALAAVK